MHCPVHGIDCIDDDDVLLPKLHVRPELVVAAAAAVVVVTAAAAAAVVPVAVVPVTVVPGTVVPGTVVTGAVVVTVVVSWPSTKEPIYLFNFKNQSKETQINLFRFLVLTICIYNNR